MNIPQQNTPSKFIGSPTKRREMDIMKLMMSDFQVQMTGENRNEFYVKFYGPKDTPYEGGVWKVRVTLPDTYPYKSPSIGFVNTIFHPNVDELSGSVCLDVINQTWSPLFDLINVFGVFLPQLLTYANPADPMNGEAASLMMKSPEAFKTRVREYVQKFAQESHVQFDSETKNNEDDDTMSDTSEAGDDDLADFEL